jgi:DNA-binding SARP family transcriptional activator
MVIEPDSATLRVQLLGPVRAWRGEQEVALGGPRRRALFGMLASARKTVSRDELIDGLWGQDPPANAQNSLHVHILGLRRALEPRRKHWVPSRLLWGVGPGYQLMLGPGARDIEVLDRHMTDARRLAADDPQAAVSSLDAALRLWQGASLAGMPGPWAEIERERLNELRRTAAVARNDLMLALGRHRQALAVLRRPSVSQHSAAS